MKRYAWLLALGAATAIPTAAIAQQPELKLQVQAESQTQATNTYRASEVLGLNIRSEDGKVLGEVTDMVIDSQSQQILYVVLTPAGLPDVQDQVIVAPANAFHYHVADAGPYFRTAVTVDRLKQAPMFQASRWSTVVTQPNWYADVNRFWGVSARAGARGGLDLDGRRPDGQRRPGGLNPDRPDRDRPNPDRPNRDRPRGDAPDVPRPDAGDAPDLPPNAGDRGPRGDRGPKADIPSPRAGDLPNVPNVPAIPNVPLPNLPK